MNRLFRVSLSLVACVSMSAAAATRPNIVIILADDLGYGDLGCYGNTVQRTPHLDRLAAEGMRFTDFYFGSAMLTACRSGRWKLQTVRQPGQAWNARPAGAMLFDLQSDIPETYDLAADRPELVTRLRERMTEFERKLQQK